METITNKEVNVHLDNEKGTLCLTRLLAGTMVFLYDSQGEYLSNSFVLRRKDFQLEK